MITKNLLNQAWEQLSHAHSFVMACHTRPDGDALGAALALARVLRSRGKEIVILAENGLPENYAFLPDSDIVSDNTDKKNFDIGILIDCNAIERVGNIGKIIETASKYACIDHHVASESFGEIRVVDSEASATCEIIFELLEANDIDIDSTTAVHLLAGIIFDTGGFRYANTSPRTLRIAAKLTELGAKPSIIAREVLENRPIRAIKLLGRALDSIETDNTGNILWATIHLTDLTDLGATDADTEGIVNAVAAAKGPQVAILFRESEPDSIRVSLRSRDGYDVNRVARAFGGGGHVPAAGCTVNASLEEAKVRVIKEVMRWMES